MLKELKLTNVGPSPEMELSFAPRLNILTGDNGLGKSFLLDTAWWALTRRWPAEVNERLPAGKMALPAPKAKGQIAFSLRGKTGKTFSYTSTFERSEQAWIGKAGRPPNPGLVLYAMVDGSFAVWDPARNYWKKKGNIDIQERLPAFVFTPSDLWEGLDVGTEPVCKGLIDDWAGWQKENGEVFATFKKVLRTFSPSDKESIEPGPLTRISISDVRDYPTLRMPYGQDVPVIHASAGMRRVIALAYLLMWSWQEHLRASEVLDEPPTDQITFLIDEIECHLHPKWQRTIIKAVLEVMKVLAQESQVQLIAGTHSPLVLASLETEFSNENDAWFDLDLVWPEKTGADAKVELTQRPFVRKGDVSTWLISNAFDLQTSGSLDRERVLHEAEVALADEAFGKSEARDLDRRLREVLSDTDPFWVNWRHVATKKGWLS